MSVEVLTQVFNRYPAGGGEFALALALADFAWPDGTHIFPGVDTLARKSRQSVRSVQTHLRVMVLRGWLMQVKAAVGRGNNSEYRINPAWLKGAELAPFVPERKGAKDGTEKVQNDALKGAEHDSTYITVRTVIEPPPSPPAGGERGFDAISAGYPRRAGIEAARRDWDELAPDDALQAEIARAIQAWIPSAEWQRENGRYIPKFGKFLRDERWLDAPGRSAPAPTPAPLPPPEPPLSPQQRAENKRRAAELAASFRRGKPGPQEARP